MLKILKQKIKNLVEVTRFFAFLCFLIEAQNFIYDFDVREKHTSAAIAFKAKAVKHVACIFACLNSACEFVPSVSNQLAAGEASYGNNHVFFSPYL
jgi:hypothetical protein